MVSVARVPTVTGGPVVLVLDGTRHEGRLHRVGQEHDVLLANLVSRGTIEERILHVLESKINLFDVIPSVTKSKLLRRDRHTCAYCANVFNERDLQCEHVMPESRGGPWTWTNLVSACAACNNRKAARTPEEAGQTLASR